MTKTYTTKPTHSQPISLVIYLKRLWILSQLKSNKINDIIGFENILNNNKSSEKEKNNFKL